MRVLRSQGTPTKTRRCKTFRATVISRILYAAPSWLVCVQLSTAWARTSWFVATSQQTVGLLQKRHAGDFRINNNKIEYSVRNDEVTTLALQEIQGNND